MRERENWHEVKVEETFGKGYVKSQRKVKEGNDDEKPIGLGDEEGNADPC